MNLIQEIQNWYQIQCDDNWEHQYGISIENIDNPGWSVKIDIVKTSHEFIEFKSIDIERSDTDWISVRRNSSVFEGFGGVNNLEEILNIFINWVNN